VQDAPTPELEARLNEVSQERDHFRMLYLEALERCVLLERGIMAGNKAERFTADGSQLTLGVLGLLLTPEVPEAPEAPAASPSSPSSPSEETILAPPPAKRRASGRRAITAMLPRVDIEVLPPEVQREGLDAFDRIGEETSEVVEHRPASLVLVRIVRPKFVRKRVARDYTPIDPDESPVLIADPPERPIERGLAGPGLLAKTIVYRWQDHLPLYRQEKIHARDGLELARSTICGWHEQLADLAERLVEAMLRDAFTQPYLCVDATGVLVQAEEQCRRAHFWVLVAPGRHVLYRYSHKHDSEAVDRLLAGYKGHLVADAHSVYDHLYRTGEIVEVGCWAHCRRYFYKALASDPARAEHALSLIRGLYRLERPVQTATRKKREEVRRQKSRPLTEAFFAWCEQQAAVVVDETPIARALGYARNQRVALCRFM
jgi:transposase